MRLFVDQRGGIFDQLGFVYLVRNFSDDDRFLDPCRSFPWPPWRVSSRPAARLEVIDDAFAAQNQAGRWENPVL